MSYNGTKLGQDIRFKNPDKDTLLSMKTPKIFSTTVSKQNIIILPIIKLWLNQQIIEFLEFEDETLVNLIINLISSSTEKIDPKNMQYQISGFLGDKTYSFMKKFWKLLINVQECYLQDKLKIPSELIPLKIEYDKQQAYKKFDRYKEYENEDKTKKELMEIIDLYKKDEKYKNNFKYKEKEKSRSRSRSHSYEKRKYQSRSRSREYRKEKEKEEYKYKSNSKKRRHKRNRSKSLSSYSNSEKEQGKYRKYKDYEYRHDNKRRKYSKNYSYRKSNSNSDNEYDEYDYNYHIKKHQKNKNYNYKKDKRDKSISSSDSSETFKI